jgi:hypothetical protein
MYCLWLSIFLFSMMWLPLTAIYSSTTIHHIPPYWFIISSLVIGIVANIVALRSINFEKIDRKYYLFFTPLFLSIYAFPFPHNLASIILAIGLIFSFFINRGKIFKAIANGFLISGIILAVQTIVLPFVFLVFSRFHRVDWLAPFISTILKLLGLESSVSQNELFVKSADKIYSFITSWDIMMLYPLLNIFVGGIILILLLSSKNINLSKVTKIPKIKNFGILFLTISLYMIFKYIGIIFTFLNVTNVRVFWRLDIMFLSLFPLTFLLTKFIRIDKIDSNSLPRIYWQRQYILPIICVIIFVFAITGFFGLFDPGIQKQGRILIDEGHSDWEWTTKKFDTEWYGRQSTYNYYSLAQYLKKFYFVEQKTENFTDSLLENYDILMIKTPTEPFSSDEINSIKKFVANGGGLFLVGDHTNVFGITTNLNPIASEFGLRFCYDGQYDLSSEMSVYRHPKLMPHPVVQNMPPFLFATGCTMEAPLLADNVIIGNGIKSIYLDYSQKSFFPKNAGAEETIEFGLFLQAAGIKYGKGRVLGFTDSTVWSNFFMFIPGKPELLIGCVEWLNRKNGFFSDLRAIFLIISLVSLMVFIFFAIKLKSRAIIPVSLFAFLLTLILSIIFFEKLNSYFYSNPKPKQKIVQVNFDYEHSEYELPILHVTRDANKSYATFYTWLQRLDFVPKVCDNFNQSLKSGDAVVIINPRKPFKKKEIENFLNYIKNGGKALIIDDPFATNVSTVGQLLNPLGMFIKPIMGRNSAVFYHKNEKDSLSFMTRNGGKVEGGTAIMFANLFPKKSNSRPTFNRSTNRQFPHLPVNDFSDQINPVVSAYQKIY